MPAALGYLWRAFCRMRGRKGGGFGPQPLEFGDFEAFQRLARIDFTPWEIELLEELDDLCLVDYAARQVTFDEE
jgi:hypothetical protein